MNWPLLTTLRNFEQTCSDRRHSARSLLVTWLSAYLYSGLHKSTNKLLSYEAIPTELAKTQRKMLIYEGKWGTKTKVKLPLYTPRGIGKSEVKLHSFSTLLDTHKTPGDKLKRRLHKPSNR